jgi:hypothetical protein
MDVTLIPVPKLPGDEEFSIHGEHCLIGRGDDCDFRLANRMVSRRHAELYTDDDSLRLRDLDSSNGTFVNGEEIDNECVLHDGDVVAFGMASFEVRIDAVSGNRIWLRLGGLRFAARVRGRAAGGDFLDVLRCEEQDGHAVEAPQQDRQQRAGDSIGPAVSRSDQERLE